MKVYAIGDLHFSGGANKPMDVFGTHWTEHMARIKENWEAIVQEEDYVLIPGDISWAMRLKDAEEDLACIEALPGKKICIRGNHDYWWDRPGKLNKKYEKTYFLQNTAYPIGDICICGTRGWISPNMEWTEEDARLYARELERLKLSLEAAQDAKEIWVMLHYPPTNHKDQVSPLMELLKHYPVTKVIYGHLHDEISWETALKGEICGIMYHLVAADYIRFEPVQIAEIE